MLLLKFSIIRKHLSLILCVALPFILVIRFMKLSVPIYPFSSIFSLDFASKLKIMNSHSMENATLCFPFYILQLFLALKYSFIGNNEFKIYKILNYYCMYHNVSKLKTWRRVTTSSTYTRMPKEW